MEYTTRSCTPDKDLSSSPSLSLSSMLEARRSELLGRARARAYGERTTTSPTEKSPCYVSLLCSYIEGWCARVYRLRGGRGWQRRVRTERERGRPLFRVLLGIFGSTRRGVRARGKTLISLLSSDSSPPHHYLSSTRLRLVAHTATASSSSTTLNRFCSSFPRYPS